MNKTSIWLGIGLGLWLGLAAAAAVEAQELSLRAVRIFPWAAAFHAGIVAIAFGQRALARCVPWALAISVASAGFTALFMYREADGLTYQCLAYNMAGASDATRRAIQGAMQDGSLDRWETADLLRRRVQDGIVLIPADQPRLTPAEGRSLLMEALKRA